MSSMKGCTSARTLASRSSAFAMSIQRSPAWCRTSKSTQCPRAARSRTARRRSGSRRRGCRRRPGCGSAPLRWRSAWRAAARRRCPAAPDCRSRAPSCPASKLFGKRFEHFAGERRETAVREPRDRVLLVDHERRAREPAATPPGPVTKPPKPTTTSGRCRRITPQRLRQRERKPERRRQQRA